MAAVVLSAAMLVVAAGCSSGDDVSDGGVATGDQTTDGQPTGGSGDGTRDDQTDGGSGDGDQPNSTDSGSSSTDSTGSGDRVPGPTFPGQCGIDEVNRQPFYSVANIEDDDPDGGLNVRDNYENGEKLVTLPEGSVVWAEDCFKRDDGAVWYLVQATGSEATGSETSDSDNTEPVSGWVNAAFLSAEISPLEPTFGGTETADKVTRVLDALAARRWEEAAEELTVSDDVFSPIAPLLGTPGPNGSPGAEDDDADQPAGRPLAVLLEEYCSVRICDGPYTVTEVRGSYLPSRVSPEVDVAFTYSGGIVTQTFRGRPTGDRVDDKAYSLDTLPGQSILAFKRNPPTVTELVGETDGVPTGLLDAAEAVRRGLLSQDGVPIPDDFMPNEGVVVSTNAYIDPSPDLRQVVTAQDLALNGDMERIWGYRDGIGTPIVATVDEQMAGYRRMVALLEPDVIGIDDRVGLSNTIDNLNEVFPQAHIVEFHRQGRGELADFNWSSVRIALEMRDRQWVLVAITADTWTI